MKEFFKKYTIHLVLIFVSPLLLTYIVFHKGHVPGLYLSFWGGFLAFFGSIFLGLVALWQNEQAKKQVDKANDFNEELIDINNRFLEIEEHRLYSHVILSEITASNFIFLQNEKHGYDCEENDLSFSIRNINGAILQKIKIIFRENKIFQSHITIPSGECRYVKMKIPKDRKDDATIIFTSCYDEETYGDFRICEWGYNDAHDERHFSIKDYQYFGITKKEKATHE